MERAAPWIPAAFALLLYAPLPMLLDENDACYYIERASEIAEGDFAKAFNRHDWYVRDPKAYRTGVLFPLAGLISVLGHGALAYRLLPVLYASGIATLVAHLAARQWGRRFGAFLGCLVVPMPYLLVQSLRPGAGLPLVFWLGASYACLEDARGALGAAPPRLRLAACGLCWGLAYLHHEIAVGFLAILLPEMLLSWGADAPGAGRLHRASRRGVWVVAGLLPPLLLEWTLLGVLVGDPLIRGRPVRGDLLPEERVVTPVSPGGGTTVWARYGERTLHGIHTLMVLPDGATRTRYGGLFLLAICGALLPLRVEGAPAGRWAWWIVVYVLFLDYLPARPWQPAWGGNYPVIPVDGRHAGIVLLPAVLLCGRFLHALARRGCFPCAAASALLVVPWLWGDVAWIWDGSAKLDGIRREAGRLLEDPARVVYTGNRAAGLMRIHLLSSGGMDYPALYGKGRRIREYADLLAERPVEADVLHHYPSLFEQEERYGRDPIPHDLAGVYGEGVLLGRTVPRRRPSLTGLLWGDAGSPPAGGDPMRSELWRLRLAGS